jgi:hypothetical protein
MLGTTIPWVQPQFLTFLSDGPPAGCAGGVPRGAKPRAKRTRFALTSRGPESQSARDGPLICAVAGGASLRTGHSVNLAALIVPIVTYHIATKLEAHNDNLGAPLTVVALLVCTPQPL